jgi:carbon monoxide dehydrogenase subunit G
MLLKNTFDVPHRIDTVWEFFEDIPQVAACLPGAELTEVVDEDDYKGRVGVSLGPVKLRFHGTAHITERDAAAKRLVLDAEGADEKGRGQASLQVIAQLTSTGAGTRVVLDQDLDLSGAAAQYGRGMIADVTSTLMGQFATNMQRRIEAKERGDDPDQVEDVVQVGGFGLGVHAARLALTRVFRRFFLPYQRPEGAL